MDPTTRPNPPETTGTPSPQTGQEKRRHGRLRTREALCPLGRIADISASGMRVRTKGKVMVDLGDHLQLEIQVADQTAIFPVKVVRMQKAGFFATDIGLEFRELTEIQRHTLNAIAHMVMAESRYRARGD